MNPNVYLSLKVITCVYIVVVYIGNMKIGEHIIEFHQINSIFNIEISHSYLIAQIEPSRSALCL